ncbi:MAG: hypothetical protein IJK46_01960 [Prevotella sp.]|nr:hypothetical protein [Prevotella sp.]
MKMTYIKPMTLGMELSEKETFLASSNKEQGILPPGSTMSKETNIEEEEKVETAIPTAFTNIWGEDEED